MAKLTKKCDLNIHDRHPDGEKSQILSKLTV